MRRLSCGLITLESPDGGLITPIRDAFVDNGCDVQVLYRHSEWELNLYDFLLIYGPMESMTWAVIRLSQWKKIPPLIVWFTEQMPSLHPGNGVYISAKLRYLSEEYCNRCKITNWLLRKKPFSGFLKRAGRLRALGEMLTLQSRGLLKLICAFTDTNSLQFHHYGLPAAVVPMGYHPEFGENLDLKRDIDVVFLGSTRDKRRNHLILELEDKLSAKGINFVIKDGSPERGHIFGRERTILLNRAKITLGIMRQPWDDPIFRLLLAAPNGSMLLSEKLLATSLGPFQPGKHFAMADLANIVEAVEYYLANDDERQKIVKQAYEFVTGEMTMRNMARKILGSIGI